MVRDTKSELVKFLFFTHLSLAFFSPFYSSSQNSSLLSLSLSLYTHHSLSLSLSLVIFILSLHLSLSLSLSLSHNFFSTTIICRTLVQRKAVWKPCCFIYIYNVLLLSNPAWNSFLGEQDRVCLSVMFVSLSCLSLCRVCLSVVFVSLSC